MLQKLGNFIPYDRADRLSSLTYGPFYVILELCENIANNRTDINKHYDLLDIIFITMSACVTT
jgi:aspartyl/asparaginyl beta-hydroxylase (cupin superfamily)